MNSVVRMIKLISRLPLTITCSQSKVNLSYLEELILQL